MSHYDWQYTDVTVKKDFDIYQDIYINNNYDLDVNIDKYSNVYENIDVKVDITGFLAVLTANIDNTSDGKYAVLGDAAIVTDAFTSQAVYDGTIASPQDDGSLAVVGAYTGSALSFGKDTYVELDLTIEAFKDGYNIAIIAEAASDLG